MKAEQSGRAYKNFKIRNIDNVVANQKCQDDTTTCGPTTNAYTATDTYMKDITEEYLKKDFVY